MRASRHLRVMRRDLNMVGELLLPYFTGRLLTTCCGPPSGPSRLRELVANILETRLTVRANRQT